MSIKKIVLWVLLIGFVWFGTSSGFFAGFIKGLAGSIG